MTTKEQAANERKFVISPRKSQKNSELMILLRTGEHRGIVFKIELIYFVFFQEVSRSHGLALINVFATAQWVCAR